VIVFCRGGRFVRPARRGFHRTDWLFALCAKRTVPTFTRDGSTAICAELSRMLARMLA
jgi:hypothetical protein